MRLAVAFLGASSLLLAHIGSPDIFHQGEAGPYRLMVTIRPPQVVPGVAEIEIRSASPDVRGISIVPLRIDGPGAQYAPKPDTAMPSKEDPQFYTGSLWLMSAGSWQVRIDVDGTRGKGRLSIPVPAVSSRTAGMQRAIAAVLIPLGLLLCAGIIAIVGAGVREAQLNPGQAPDARRRQRARVAMTTTALVVVALLYLGNKWWDAEAGWAGRYIFKPLDLVAETDGDRLLLRLQNPGWLNRDVDDLVPDHRHLMHLYVLSIPEMDRVWHLHPERSGPGRFEQHLPEMPAGRYALYGDIVHRSGLAETVTAEIELPAISGRPLSGDDSTGVGPPRSQADYNRVLTTLADGYRMVWDRPAEPLRAGVPLLFRFRLEDPNGRPADAMELYMGMLGHAAFVRADRSVFAHVHPSGSVPMAALSLVQPADPHAGHSMMHAELPPDVSFPYGFPKGGEYRVVVQMKRAGRVQTGLFDVRVEN